MSFRDFLLLFGVCLVWGLNIVVTRWAIVEGGVPPIFYAGVRFALIAIVLFWMLRPIPKNIGLLLVVSMCMGAAHFALLFMGLANAEASAAAIVGQLGVPFTTLMSMAFLGETVGWRRALGIMMSFAGTVLIAFDPGSFSVSIGLLFIVISAFIGSVGAIVMKRMTPMPALQLQAWVGLFSFMPLFAVSAIVEGGGQGLALQWTAFANGGWLVWVATAFAVLGVSIFGHGGFYVLLKRYDVSLLSPLTLMTPIWGMVFGISLLGETLTLQLVVGAAISLLGVFIIAVRPNTKMPEAGLGKKTVAS